MDNPKMFSHREIAPETFLLPAYTPVPSLGVLPVNAFLIRGRQPILIDAGLPLLAEELVASLAELVDPADIRWIWLTHTDPDHIGALARVLSLAPRAKVITTFLGMGKMGLSQPLPPERVHLLNPGQSFEAGDRELVALQPPSFDAPETTGLFDTRSRALFSSDCFGAVLAAPLESASAIAPDDLREGIATWTSIDAPWLGKIDDRAFARSLESIAGLQPASIFSSHLPPAFGLTGALLDSLGGARRREPFVGPDQAALSAMFAAA